MKLLVDMISTGRSEALSNDMCLSFIFGTKRKFFCFHLQRIRAEMEPLLNEIKPFYMLSWY